MNPDWSWIEQANCRGVDTGLFYPERGESCEDAKTVCASCTVRAECLEAGMGEKHGIWGGTSERERRHLRRQRRSEGLTAWGGDGS